MAKILGKDPALYACERDAFLRELKQFHDNRGTPFRRPPIIGTVEIDLYLLYNLVTSKGGWVKLTNKNEWGSLAECFNLPAQCVNIGVALKNIYIRYLDRYEKIHYLGEDADRGSDDDDEGGKHKRWSARVMHTIPLSYNYQQHNIGESTRTANGLSADLYKPSDYNRLMLCLLSPLPNEQDFAINTCTLLSNEGKHHLKLEKCPKLIDYLLAHAGVFNHTSLRPLFHHVYSEVRKQSLTSFWSDALIQEQFTDLTNETKFVKRRTVLPVLNTFSKKDKLNGDERSAEIASNTTTITSSSSSNNSSDNITSISTDERLNVKSENCDEHVPSTSFSDSKTSAVVMNSSEDSSDNELFAPEPKVKLKITADDRDLFCVGRTLGTQEYVGQRVLQIANILRNLSFTEDNVSMLANNITFVRFLMLCTNSRWNTLHQYGFDMLSNIAGDVQLKDPIRDRLSECILLTITNGLACEDRFVVISSLDVLNKLSQNEANEDVLLRYLEQNVYEQVCLFLTIQDIMLLIYTLECMYALSALGERSCNKLSKVRGIYGTLVSLVTVEAQSYGPKACIGMKVVETVPPGSTIQPAQTATTTQSQSTSSLTSTTTTALTNSLFTTCIANSGVPMCSPSVATPIYTTSIPISTPPTTPVTKTASNNNATLVTSSCNTVTSRNPPVNVTKPSTPSLSTPSQPVITTTVQTPPPPIPTPPTQPIVSQQQSALSKIQAQSLNHNVQQQHAHQQAIQENEQFALAWLRATFEPDIKGRIEQQELYRNYLNSCSKIGRKGVIAPLHFPRCVRSTFGGTVGPNPNKADNLQYYEGIKLRAQPLIINCITALGQQPVSAPSGVQTVTVTTPKTNNRRQKNTQAANNAAAAAVVAAAAAAQCGGTTVQDNTNPAILTPIQVLSSTTSVITTSTTMCSNTLLSDNELITTTPPQSPASPVLKAQLSAPFKRTGCGGDLPTAVVANTTASNNNSIVKIESTKSQVSAHPHLSQALLGTITPGSSNIINQTPMMVVAATTQSIASALAAQQSITSSCSQSTAATSSSSPVITPTAIVINSATAAACVQQQQQQQQQQQPPPNSSSLIKSLLATKVTNDCMTIPMSMRTASVVTTECHPVSSASSHVVVNAQQVTQRQQRMAQIHTQSLGQPAVIQTIKTVKLGKQNQQQQSSSADTIVPITNNMSATCGRLNGAQNEPSTPSEFSAAVSVINARGQNVVRTVPTPPPLAPLTRKITPVQKMDSDDQQPPMLLAVTTQQQISSSEDGDNSFDGLLMNGMDSQSGPGDDEVKPVVKTQSLMLADLLEKKIDKKEPPPMNGVLRLGDKGLELVENHIEKVLMSKVENESKEVSVIVDSNEINRTTNPPDVFSSDSNMSTLKRSASDDPSDHQAKRPHLSSVIVSNTNVNGNLSVDSTTTDTVDSSNGDETEVGSVSSTAANLYAALAADVLDEEDLEDDEIPSTPQPSITTPAAPQPQPPPPPPPTPITAQIAATVQQPNRMLTSPSPSPSPTPQQLIVHHTGNRQIIVSQPQVINTPSGAQMIFTGSQFIQQNCPIKTSTPVAAAAQSHQMPVLVQATNPTVSGQTGPRMVFSQMPQSVQFVGAQGNHHQSYVISSNNAAGQTTYVMAQPQTAIVQGQPQTVLVAQTTGQGASAKTIIILQPQNAGGNTAAGGGNGPQKVVVTPQGQPVVMTQVGGRPAVIQTTNVMTSNNHSGTTPSISVAPSAVATAAAPCMNIIKTPISAASLGVASSVVVSSVNKTLVTSTGIAAAATPVSVVSTGNNPIMNVSKVCTPGGGTNSNQIIVQNSINSCVNTSVVTTVTDSNNKPIGIVVTSTAPTVRTSCVATNTTNNSANLISNKSTVGVVGAGVRTINNSSNSTSITDSIFVCEWRGCQSKMGYKSANEVLLHAVEVHCPADSDDMVCMWERCDNLKRKRFSLMTHLIDRHCNPEAMKVSALRRKQLSLSGRSTDNQSSSITPTHPGYAPDAALHAIKRHALEFVNPKELMDDNEGPVTKSIRLTASLILRNLVIYANNSRRYLRHYEPHLANVAMSNVESSRTIAQILYDLNESGSGR